MPTNFRLVCATNRDLRAEVGSGAFRADLYYRIAGWTCELPPLRDRTEDILPLAAHFFQADSDPSDVFDPLVCEYLLRREYPGNVRELRQVVETLRARHANKGVVTVGALRCQERCVDMVTSSWRDHHFEAAIRRAMDMGVKLKELSQVAAETAVHVVVQAEDGNLQRAARRLGVTDRALQMRRANGHRH
jgi:transcriptional regulator with GAF, ATPase, and Fis domain